MLILDKFLHTKQNNLKDSDRHRYQATVLALLCLVVLLTAGCGKTEQELNEVITYRNTMNELFTSLADCENEFNTLDAGQSNASEQLLHAVDQMTAAVKRASEAKAPGRFSKVQDLAVDAADSMQTADRLFHQALDNDYDADAFSSALASYKDACAMIGDITRYMQENVP